MKKIKGRIAVRTVLELMVEADHISQDMVDFIDELLGEFLFQKKMSHSIESLIRFNTNLVDINCLKNGLYELGYAVTDDNGK